LCRVLVLRLETGGKTEEKWKSRKLNRQPDAGKKRRSKVVTVTDSAKGLLKGILTAHSDDPKMGLRLALDPQGQLGLLLGEEEPGDLVVEQQESKVLLIASELAPALEEVSLDVEDTGDGPKVVVEKE
jgi:Fe-S cluster assembly iron-binding protein IscA